MKVIEGGFNKDKRQTALEVFTVVCEMEKIEDFEEAFCVAKSGQQLIISTNMDTYETHFLLEQLKLAILTAGDEEI